MSLNDFIYLINLIFYYYIFYLLLIYYFKRVEKVGGDFINN
jgi:hypothetical protein